MDLTKQTLKLPYRNEKEEFAQPAIPVSTSLSDYFLSVLPPSLVREIWDFFHEDTWEQGRRGALLHGICNEKALYTYFSAYLWITVNPSDDKSRSRPLRDDFDRAVAHFEDIALSREMRMIWKEEEEEEERRSK